MAISRGQKAGTSIGGGLGGAATGALIGSAVPGIGTAIGAGVGGLAGLLSSLLGAGKTSNQIAKEQQKYALQNPMTSGINGSNISPQGLPEGVGTYNLYTPQQQQAFNTVLQQALGGLGQNQFDFAPIEAKARKGFAEQTIPSIAERFTQLGAQRSGAFQQALGQAGSGLESDLAAMKSDYNLKQQQYLQDLLGIGLKPQYEAYYRPGDESGSFGKNLAQQLLTKENLQGAGELAGWAKQKWNSRGSNNGNNTGSQSGTPDFKASNVLSPTSSYGSSQALYNPGNAASGLQSPNMMGSNINSSSSIPSSRLGVLKSLYGL